MLQRRMGKNSVLMYVVDRRTGPVRAQMERSCTKAQMNVLALAACKEMSLLNSEMGWKMDAEKQLHVIVATWFCMVPHVDISICTSKTYPFNTSNLLYALVQT